jgi:glutathione peroxidase
MCKGIASITLPAYSGAGSVVERFLMSIYEITANLIDGTPKSLGDYRGKVLLIVNVASKCGFAPQYAGLEALYRRYQNDGLVVLGFPCDQFGRQEFDDPNAIQQFCTRNYGVSFPIFAKVDVNGPHTHPLFAYLKAERPGFLGTQTIKWNFTKFLVDREGKVRRRYAPTDTPEAIERDIVALLRRSHPATAH